MSSIERSKSMLKVMEEQKEASVKFRFEDMSPPFNVDNKESKEFFSEYVKTLDSWHNSVANVNTGNSIMKYSEFEVKRLSYQECAALYSDPIINKAITVIVNEMLNKWGKVVLETTDSKNEKENEKMIKHIESELVRLDIKNVAKKFLTTALTFGGTFVYLNFKGEDASKPVYINHKHLKSRELSSVKSIEPWLIGPLEVNTSNPIEDDYMKPKSWSVSSQGKIDANRIITVSFYHSTDLFKPLYNFLGISLCQFMKDHVKCAEIIRQSLADLFLRFRNVIIKTNLSKVDPQEAVDRVKVINSQSNNLGSIILASDEDYIENVTSLSGLDNIQSQSFENMVISSRLPATKLLGISPNGFNSTGEFDLNNYYDEISGYQHNVLKPVLDQIIQIIVLSKYDTDLKFSFEFNPLEKMNELELSDLTQKKIDSIMNLYNNGILNDEQVFEQLQKEGLINSDFKFDASAKDELDELENKDYGEEENREQKS